MALVRRGKPVEAAVRHEALERQRLARVVAKAFQQRGEEPLRREGTAIPHAGHALVLHERGHEVEHGAARAMRQAARLGQRGDVVEARPLERAEDGEGLDRTPGLRAVQKPELIRSTPPRMRRHAGLHADPGPCRRAAAGPAQLAVGRPSERGYEVTVAIELHEAPVSRSRLEADERAPAPDPDRGIGRAERVAESLESRRIEGEYLRAIQPGGQAGGGGAVHGHDDDTIRRVRALLIGAAVLCVACAEVVSVARVAR